MSGDSSLRRLIVLCFSLGALALGSCGDDGPGPGPSGPDYFPFSLGSTWAYVSQDPTGALQSDTLFVSVVADTMVGQNRAAKLLFKQQRSGPAGPGNPSVTSLSKYYLLVAFEGNWVNYYTEDGQLTFQRYRLPFAEGEIWDLQDPGSQWHITYRVVEPAEISVPAGDFAYCVAIRHTEYELGYTDSETEYFTDGVGLVMLSHEETGSALVLVEYDMK